MTSSLPTLSEAFDSALSLLDSVYGKSQADRPLWPAPYNELTSDAAYRFLTECWWTENEANQRISLIPQKEVVRKYVEEWVRCFLAKRPMWTEKSRRLMISWASRGLETWALGIKKGSLLIVDQTDENAGEHLWRVHFCLNNLYEKRPEMRLRPHEVRGAVLTHNVSDVILPNGSWLTQSHQEAGASQGKGKTIVTLEELSKYKAPTAFVGQAVIVTQGEGDEKGGWVNGIANASPNPDWHSIKPDGIDANGKPKHVKAAELLQDPKAQIAVGFAAKDLPNGDRYLAIHYTADEAKRGTWRMSFTNVPPREWEREMELNEDIHAGKPVYETYDDKRHCPPKYHAKGIPNVQGSTYVGGWDCGTTMRPAFVLLQITPSPSFQTHCILEVASEGNEPMSMFAPRVLKALQDRLPGDWPDVIHVGDGTIRNRMGNVGKSAADVAQPTIGTLIEPMSNIESVRQSAVTDLLMGEIPVGKGSAPRFLLDASCGYVRSGFNGAYKYAPVTLSDGSTTYSPHPVKNIQAESHDALQYAAQKAWIVMEGKSGGKVHRRGKR